jgi:Putative MetA-pathway of phenol degradation
VRVGLFTLSLLIMASSAVAQQPFSTEEPDVAGPRSVKLSVGVEFDALRPDDSDHDRQTTTMMRAAYGAARNLEIELSAPVIHVTNAGEPSATGYGDTSVRAKYQVREDTNGPAVAVAFTVQAPTGDPDRDIGSGVAMTWIDAIVGKDVSSRTKVHANIGFMPTGNPSIGALGINARRGRILTFGGSATREMTRALKIGGELYGATTTTGPAARQLHALVGGQYEVRRGFTIDFGALVGRFERTPRFGALTGVTITVPRAAARQHQEATCI